MCSAVIATPAPDLRTALASTAPPALEYLPGGWLELQIAPLPRWPIEHRNIRALHGLVTGLLKVKHLPTLPCFALAPWPDGVGWRVYVLDMDVALRAAGEIHSAELFGKAVMVKCSGMRRIKAPQIEWGMKHIVVRTMTPIVLRKTVTDKKRKYFSRELELANLLSVLAAWVPPRLGMTIEPGCLVAKLVANNTTCETVRLGGKLGDVVGLGGTIVLEANGPVRWLLHAAETIGLGGRTAFGFGRLGVKS